MQREAGLYVVLISQISLASSNFSSLNSTQLLSPTRSRLRFFDGTQLVGSVARHADVIVALENELEISKFEGRRLAEFCEAAGCDNDLVDKVISDLEKGLHWH